MIMQNGCRASGMEPHHCGGWEIVATRTILRPPRRSAANAKGASAYYESNCQNQSGTPPPQETTPDRRGRSEVGAHSSNTSRRERVRVRAENVRTKSRAQQVLFFDMIMQNRCRSALRFIRASAADWQSAKWTHVTTSCSVKPGDCYQHISLSCARSRRGSTNV